MTTLVEAARAETAAVYSALTREYRAAGQHRRRAARSLTYRERERIDRAVADALTETVAIALARHGSIHAAMQATGKSYEYVQAVLRGMEGTA